MKKIKLTKEQAGALLDYKEYRELEDCLRGFIGFKHNWTKEYKPLTDLTLKEFTLALINGYEIVE